MYRDLIVFGEDWGGLPSSTQHIIRHLAEKRKIVWVNSIGLRQPHFGIRDFKRILSKLFAIKENNSAVNTINNLPENNFHIVNPKTLPAPRSKFARWLATKLLVSQIKPVAQTAGLTQPVLWTSLPTAVDIAGQLDESALVYYCGDDFSALAGVDHDIVNKREQELLEKSDLILAASENLTQRFPVKKTHLLTHGVDLSLFTKPAPRANDLPNDGRPIAGFYGSISAWLDIDLLCETISRMPNWHFVFIGKAVVDTSALKQFNNVYFLGERSHQQLPAYSQHWTASLLPFKNNAQIRACNPLKLREYLAAGSPVISTSFPALNRYHDVVQVVTDSDGMVNALEASKLMKPLKSFSEMAQESVNNDSWSAKAEQVSQWIDSL